ncbi:DUF6745 domain-containing protein [Phormidium nigroviride]
MSETKIDKLTPEQEALIPVYLEKWRTLALSTQPIDCLKAAQTVKSAYVFMDLAEPKIIFCYSPYAALNQICSQLGREFTLSSLMPMKFEKLLFSQVRDQVNPEFFNSLESVLLNPSSSQSYRNIMQLWSQLSLQLSQKLGRKRMSFHHWEIASETFNFMSAYDFCISLLNCSYNQSIWKLCQDLAKLGWIYPFENTCIVCDRPRILSFDNQHRLHAEGTPAIQFADGYSLYSYHGVTLPEKYGKLHPHQWQSQWLLEEENTELRRVLIQGIGYSRICQELEAVELDTWREYSLLRIDKNIDFEPINMLKMTCPSTGYIHFFGVPPEIISAREAIKCVNWGVDAEDFSVQT